MNVTALAYGLIRLRFDKDAEWLARVEKSAARLKAMAQQINYDFNSQGYDFAKGAAFTNQDIYRQPDAVGGYSYVMLLAWKLTGQGPLSGGSQDRHRSLHGLCRQPLVRGSQRSDGGDGGGASGGNGLSNQHQKRIGFCLRHAGWFDGVGAVGRA